MIVFCLIPLLKIISLASTIFEHKLNFFIYSSV